MRREIHIRELLAIELRSDTSTNDDARGLVDDWTLKHNGDHPLAKDMDATTSPTDSGQEVFVVEQTDSEESSRRWRTEVAVGAPGEPAHVTVRVRMGASSATTLAPVSYDLRTPAIVRTLLRELEINDGHERCQAGLKAEIGASQVSGLVDLLTAQRRLPVVVVSRKNDSGQTLVDVHDLARELAGLAHVRVLSSTQTSYKLTEFVGQERSVFDGAVRVYFDGFTTASPPREHKLYFPNQLGAHPVDRIRGFLGSLSTALTPEHPAYAELREERRHLVDGADVDEVRLWNTTLLEDNESLRSEFEEERVKVASLTKELERAKYDLDQINQNFADLGLSMRNSDGAETEELQTVADAMGEVESLAFTHFYRSRVAVTQAALKSGRSFKHYKAPEELLRAVQAVLEAGALAFDGKLGTTPKDFFNLRGFGYGAQPSPHLKVDESTTEDQCLRIYWKVESETGKWEITSIGEHS